MLQDRPGQPGASATELVGSDLFFKHFDANGASCRIRELGIHLDTLQPFGEMESDGVLVMNHGFAVNPATRRAILLPLGKGMVGSPLVDIDGHATLDRKIPLPQVAAKAPVSTTNVGNPSCVRDESCRVERTWNVPKCAGAKIVDTRSTLWPFQPDGNGDECVGRSYWLVRGGEASPVLLADDCETQTGPATTGTATIQIENCNLFFKYVETEWDDACFVREIGLRLDTLQVFRETQREGVVRKDQCKARASRRRPIHLPRGRGVAGNPLIELDGSVTST
jgi:hypothetical protein